MVRCETYLDVRYYETDLMGIVHHSNYIRYMECGRHDMLVQFGIPIWEIERQGVMAPIVSVESRYLRPARMGDRLKVVTMVDSIPTAKLFIRNEIYNQNGELLNTGKVTLGFIDADTRRPVRAPRQVVEALKAHFK
ncbi:MAG: acyl-CoA thioesterase [Bacteroidetes bacterium]|uniref:Acyl-CoA thioesterase n=1 Tax=Candidatus Merdivivens pullistercoris TaxID=2840873 RepID=A0A9D9N940_9BACT|nr:acyl-CoA thioesterase [Candidatus Merdivivens pullistercoris]